MKTNEEPKLHIPNPCLKKWGKMLPNGKDKYCLSCKKNVYNFTNKTNEEITSFIDSKKGEIVCGKITSNQISSKKKVYSISKIAAFLIPPFLILNGKEAKSQDIKPFNSPTSYQDTIQTDSITISGKVIDKETKEPLPFAKIHLKKTDLKVVTDLDGSFNLNILKNNLPDSLIVKNIGYTDLSFYLNSTEENNINIELEAEVIFIGTIIYTKPKRGLKNLFRRRKNNS